MYREEGALRHTAYSITGVGLYFCDLLVSKCKYVDAVRHFKIGHGTGMGLPSESIIYLREEPGIARVLAGSGMP